MPLDAPRREHRREHVRGIAQLLQLLAQLVQFLGAQFLGLASPLPDPRQPLGQDRPRLRHDRCGEAFGLRVVRRAQPAPTLDHLAQIEQETDRFRRRQRGTNLGAHRPPARLERRGQRLQRRGVEAQRRLFRDDLLDQHVEVAQRPDHLPEPPRRRIQRGEGLLPEARPEDGERRAQPPQADPQLVRPLDRVARRHHDHVLGDLRKAVAQDIARDALDGGRGGEARCAGLARLERRVRHTLLEQPPPARRLVERREPDRPPVEQPPRHLEERGHLPFDQLELGLQDGRPRRARNDLAAVEGEFHQPATGRAQHLGRPVHVRLEQGRRRASVEQRRDAAIDAVRVVPRQVEPPARCRKVDLAVREHPAPAAAAQLDVLDPAATLASQPQRDSGAGQHLIGRVEIDRDQRGAPRLALAHRRKRRMPPQTPVGFGVQHDLQFDLPHAQRLITIVTARGKPLF